MVRPVSIATVLIALGLALVLAQDASARPVHRRAARRGILQEDEESSVVDSLHEPPREEPVTHDSESPPEPAIPDEAASRDAIETLVHELELARTLVNRANERLARMDPQYHNDENTVDQVIEDAHLDISDREAKAHNDAPLPPVAARSKPSRGSSRSKSATRLSSEEDHQHAAASKSKKRSATKRHKSPATDESTGGSTHSNVPEEHRELHVERELESMESPSSRQRLRVLSEDTNRARRAHAHRKQQRVSRRRPESSAEESGDEEARESEVRTDSEGPESNGDE